MSSLHLTDERRSAFDTLARDLAQVFSERFVALVAYDAHHSVVFSTTITLTDLAAAARRADRWREHDLEVPLLITPDEFRRSLDAFPVEYGAILRRHAVIAGAPPFNGAAVDDADVRRALEVQAKGHLLHLRAGVIATGGREAEGRALIAASIDPFRSLLANAARLDRAEAHADADLAEFAASRLGVPAAAVASLLALDQRDDFDPSATMPGYLDAVERTWRALDRFGEARR